MGCCQAKEVPSEIQNNIMVAKSQQKYKEDLVQNSEKLEQLEQIKFIEESFKIFDDQSINYKTSTIKINSPKSSMGFSISQHPINILNQKVQQILTQLGEFNYRHKEYEDPNSFSFDWFQLKNNSYYKGQWKNSLRHGKGKIIWKDGSIYEGYWKNNKIYGYGRFINFKGDIYEGEFLDQDAQQTFSFGDNNMFQFQSKLISSSNIQGNQIIDQQKEKIQVNDQFTFHGKGIYKWADGCIYEGNWQFDQMKGFGQFIWPNGQKYIGEFYQNKRQGIGELVYPDGSIYKGPFVNGKQVIIFNIKLF